MLSYYLLLYGGSEVQNSRVSTAAVYREKTRLWNVDIPVVLHSLRASK